MNGRKLNQYAISYKTAENTLALILRIYKHQLNSYFQTVKFTFAFHRAELVGKHTSGSCCHPESHSSLHISTGAFFNGVFLLALAISIFLQSIERFVHLEEIEEPFLVLIIGCVGLGLNVISALVVHGMFHRR